MRGPLETCQLKHCYRAKLSRKRLGKLIDLYRIPAEKSFNKSSTIINSSFDGNYTTDDQIMLIEGNNCIGECKCRLTHANDRLPKKFITRYLIVFRVFIISTLFVKLIIHTFIVKSDGDKYKWTEPYLSNPYACYKNYHMYNGINFSLLIFHIFVLFRNYLESRKLNKITNSSAINNDHLLEQNRDYYDYAHEVSSKRVEIGYISCIRVATWTEYRCLFKAAFMRFSDRMKGINEADRNSICGDEEFSIYIKKRRVLECETNFHLSFKYNLIDFENSYRCYTEKLTSLGKETRKAIESCRWLSASKLYSMYKSDFYQPKPIHRMDIDYLGSACLTMAGVLIWDAFVFISGIVLTQSLEMDIVKQRLPEFKDYSKFDLRLYAQLGKFPHIMRLNDICMIYLNHLTHHSECLFQFWSCYCFNSRVNKLDSMLESNVRTIKQIEEECFLRTGLFDKHYDGDYDEEEDDIEKDKDDDAKVKTLKDIEFIKSLNNLRFKIQYDVSLISVMQHEFQEIKLENSGLMNILIVANIVVIPALLAIFIKNDYHCWFELLIPISILLSLSVPFMFICFANASTERKVCKQNDRL